MSRQNFKAALLFFLECLLVGEQLLDQGLRVEAVVRHAHVLPDDSHAIHEIHAGILKSIDILAKDRACEAAMPPRYPTDRSHGKHSKNSGGECVSESVSK